MSTRPPMNEFALQSRPGGGREEDRSLMALVAGGNAHARRVLLTRIAPRVQRICMAVLRNKDDADDASQLALLDVLRAAASWRGDGSLERWCDRLAGRRAVRCAKRETRQRSLLDNEADPQAIAAPRQSESLGERLPRALQDYLDALSPERRQALVLKHALGYSVQEIAKELEVAEGTIKDRLVVGRKQLRKMIARDELVGAFAGGSGT